MQEMNFEDSQKMVRQMRSMGINLSAPWYCALDIAFAGDQAGGRHTLRALAESSVGSVQICASGHGAVSYTHLDVYKRQLYAQNDPLWKKLVFEIQTSSRRRPFGDGGCGPTAVAMAIANLVEKEELCKLSAFASSPLGFRFCSCSVNDYWCAGKHLTYQLTTPDEYLRYFPLAIANFATGNNIWGVQGLSLIHISSSASLKTT